MAVSIAIVNLGMGNPSGVYKKLYQLGANAFLAATPDLVVKADKIILPGVGHFEKACQKLHELHLFDILNEMVLIKKKSVLGICLGMQIMGNESEEGKATGLGWFNTKVVRFRLTDPLRHKIPHVGWNTVDRYNRGTLLKNIDDNSEFYFLHSYHYDTLISESFIAKTNYEYDFISLVENGHIFATQFHPEKSHHAGSQLLKNFIEF
ncbi:MAG TPA: imidazole glycerol phosphate synthase subunit HisH [Chitinophagaceae bacterium]|nr:imidazole glycerol phosphate synthase subunit HisH [Chitinophagaceae bacterium]